MKTTLISLRRWTVFALTLCWVQLACAYYDPGEQRWINRDPIQEVGGPNLYQLVRNSPIRQVDASGLLPDLPDPGEQVLQDCLCIRRLAKTIQQALRDKGFPIGNELTGGNAYQHCIISCAASKRCGADATRRFLTDYERRQPLSEQSELQRGMDLKNNDVGYGIKGDCAKGCADAWREGRLTCINFADRQHMPCPASGMPEYF